MTHRFFVPSSAIVHERVTLDRDLAHQLRSVLRLRPGDQVTVLDNSGWAYQVELTALAHDSAHGRICARQPVDTEPGISLTLYLSVLKGDHLEWVLQKGTELGVSTFVPVISQRTIVADAERLDKKRPRWERIIREAAEQSHRGLLPTLASALSFSQSCQRGVTSYELALLLWEQAAGSSLPAVLAALERPPTRVAMWIGPEGGFTPEEVSLAAQHGIRAVTLGPRILRAETAALAASAIAMAALGEMENGDANDLIPG
jgi:16S rRNA (uracil1498-N3)-methyltransferase